jgi:hypothetical protein
MFFVATDLAKASGTAMKQWQASDEESSIFIMK